MSKKFWRQGEPFVWATGLALSLILFLTLLLIYVVTANGISVFWPKPVALATLSDGQRLIGEIVQEETIPGTENKRLQFKIGNRDLYGLDFKWVESANIVSLAFPKEIQVLERQEYGNFYGFLHELEVKSIAPPASGSNSLVLTIAALDERKNEMHLLGKKIANLNRRVELIDHHLTKALYNKEKNTPALAAMQGEKQGLKTEFEALVSILGEKSAALATNQAIFTDANGRTKAIALANIVRTYQPNAMSFFAKCGYYLERLRELFFDEPRESNTEGGLFPAIFGTVMLIFLMSILSFPLGVLAGIYLREYAKDGWLVRLVRIAVNNLAGIPSIVYGIFGLGFFVYGIGGAIDQFFFPERLPTPTFGTGGILWTSLTLGLLTVPVVIVATEEALGSIPPGIREGSQALAATKLQTLTRILLPMASPGILTGFILAMARAAGEVAPLMITGVVKLAPALPLDRVFPYLHLDRKFMHLGFHIYDIGFQSPNVEAAKPMVYVTTLLLILIVLAMTSTAIYLRNKMRQQHSVVDV
ncbi:MAG: phosphate ABC transporter, permease protein PstA [Deltaproteobacteria bacterium RIFOXYD12_FULL_53_23]|nr:MAG: phosphate ABC transporter, permease protein PstA [Deltaproteobacteria bacterium RIFOXYD12_FULL_53_23]